MVSFEAFFNTLQLQMFMIHHSCICYLCLTALMYNLGEAFHQIQVHFMCIIGIHWLQDFLMHMQSSLCDENTALLSDHLVLEIQIFSEFRLSSF